MQLLDDSSLERSAVVANSRMNRERGAIGVNSYEKDLGIDPIAFLANRQHVTSNAAWLDLCCGRGRALIDAGQTLRQPNLTLHGVDLVDLFDEIPSDVTCLKLESASLHQWEAPRCYDLITCVHGLHYLGDKLSLVERAVSWLTLEGMFLANLDLSNLRSSDAQPLGERIIKRFRACGLSYSRRRYVVTCAGAQSISFGYRYVGADDAAGPNYTAQEAVDSHYTPNA